MFKYTSIFLRSCDFNNKSSSSDFSIINIFCSQSCRTKFRAYPRLYPRGRKGRRAVYLLGISQNPIQLHVVAALERVGGSLARKEVPQFSDNSCNGRGQSCAAFAMMPMTIRIRCQKEISFFLEKIIYTYIQNIDTIERKF